MASSTTAPTDGSASVSSRSPQNRSGWAWQTRTRPARGRDRALVRSLRSPRTRNGACRRQRHRPAHRQESHHGHGRHPGRRERTGAGSTFWLELRTTTSLAVARDVRSGGGTRGAAPWRPSICACSLPRTIRWGAVFAQQLRKLACTAELPRTARRPGTAGALAKHDVVITDVHMPGVNGYELTERIRSAEIGQDGQATYIIGASANAMKQAAQEAIARGMDDYVTSRSRSPGCAMRSHARLSAAAMPRLPPMPPTPGTDAACLPRPRRRRRRRLGDAGWTAARWGRRRIATSPGCRARPDSARRAGRW